MESSSVVEDAKQSGASYLNIILMAIVTHIIFVCCVYGMWTATGDLMKSDWTGCVSKILFVFMLFIFFATTKTMTLNRLFDRV
jgi:4-hydroxybenzoate polyprenyltransferase